MIVEKSNHRLRALVDANANAEFRFGCSREATRDQGFLPFYAAQQPDGLSLEDAIRTREPAVRGPVVAQFEADLAEVLGGLERL